MNKLFVVAALVVAFVAGLANTSTQANAVQTRAASSTVIVHEGTFTPSEDTTVSFQADKIVGHRTTAHKAPVASKKVWACGAVEQNLVGGSQRTCNWI
jgi:hypothetical protein